MLDAHRAPIADAELLLHELGELLDVELPHRRHVLGHASAAPTVGFADDLVHERLPSVAAVEVAAATDEKRLVEGALQGAVGGLDIPILLLLAHLRCARFHAVVPHDREVVLVERALAAALAGDALAVRDPMRRGGRVVGLMPLGDTSELKERALYAVPDRRDRLGQADARPSPVGVRQHEHAQHVHEQLSDDRHSQLRCPGEVGLRSLARPV